MTCSLFGMCRMCDTGRAGDPRASLDCGGGVGNAFGGIDEAASPSAALSCPGEKGGVGASGRLAGMYGRGVVEPRDIVPPVLGTGVLCIDALGVGLSTCTDLALLGVDFEIVGRRVSPFALGKTMSDGTMDSAQGLLDLSSTLFLVLLSARRSRML